MAERFGKHIISQDNDVVLVSTSKSKYYDASTGIDCRAEYPPRFNGPYACTYQIKLHSQILS